MAREEKLQLAAGRKTLEGGGSQKRILNQSLFGKEEGGKEEWGCGGGG